MIHLAAHLHLCFPPVIQGINGGWSETMKSLITEKKATKNENIACCLIGGNRNRINLGTKAARQYNTKN
ncbi:unnamed protein product [Heterobilharzia americana]|nr:unnamed protein product [Heterobilharzia americana]